MPGALYCLSTCVRLTLTHWEKTQKCKNIHILCVLQNSHLYYVKVYGMCKTIIRTGGLRLNNLNFSLVGTYADVNDIVISLKWKLAM